MKLNLYKAERVFKIIGTVIIVSVIVVVYGVTIIPYFFPFLDEAVIIETEETAETFENAESVEAFRTTDSPIEAISEASHTQTTNPIEISETMPPNSTDEILPIETSAAVSTPYTSKEVIPAETSTAASSQAATPQTTTTAASPEASLININTANSAQLQTLKGIGEVKAQAIIDYRNNNGYFTSVDELINVSGIGEKTLENIRPYITV